MRKGEGGGFNQKDGVVGLEGDQADVILQAMQKVCHLVDEFKKASVF